MKKVIVKVLGLFLLLVVVALVGLYFSLNSIVKKGMETKGSTITKVNIKVGGVNLSPFSGQGQITRMVIGNPEGFASESAIKVGDVKVALKPTSVFSDTILVDYIYVEAPEITFEGKINGNNLSKILDNIQNSTPTASGGGAAKKIQIGDLKITGGKIHLNMSSVGIKPTTESLPEIHLTDLGKESGGITPRELSQKLAKVILDEVIASSGGTITAKGVMDSAKGLSKEPLEQVDKATKGLKDLLKKK
jgi:uncharacterized protein involved in outer membrane biogenesis